MAGHESLDVLIVDDDPDDVFLIRKGIEAGVRDGCRVTTSVAHDGAIALAVLRQRLRDGRPPPDLVILDLNMPNMDGEALLREIRHDPALRGCRVAVLTTSFESSVHASARAAGADDVFAKPPTLPELNTVIASILAPVRRGRR